MRRGTGVDVPLVKPRPGDDLLQLAGLHGVSSAAISSHPDNAELFAARAPAVLHEDDEVFVPDPEPRTIGVSAGHTHYLVHKPLMRKLHLQLRGEDGAYREVDYELSGFEYDGPKPDLGFPLPTQLFGYAYQGIVEEQLYAGVARVTLTLADAASDPIVLELGRLDPVSTTRGLKARLQGLGLYLGDLSSATYDAETELAVCRFQQQQGLPLTGYADPELRSRLRTVFGG